MNRLALASLLCAFAFAAQAQSPATQAASPAATVVADEPAEPEAVIEVKGDDSLSSKSCLRHTGTRIQRHRGKSACNHLAGTSYSRDEIDRTGAMTVADAIERLDPRVTVRN